MFEEPFGFRRATHDKDNGEYLEDKFADYKGNTVWYQKEVWDNHGHIAHMMSSEKAMSLTDILTEIRRDSTNYYYDPADLKNCFYDGSKLPEPNEVALSLLRLIEAGFVEVVPNEKYPCPVNNFAGDTNRAQRL
jgi:hypothetical protein